MTKKGNYTFEQKKDITQSQGLVDKLVKNLIKFNVFLIKLYFLFNRSQASATSVTRKNTSRNAIYRKKIRFHYACLSRKR